MIKRIINDYYYIIIITLTLLLCEGHTHTHKIVCGNVIWNEQKQGFYNHDDLFRRDYCTWTFNVSFSLKQNVYILDIEYRQRAYTLARAARWEFCTKADLNIARSPSLFSGSIWNSWELHINSSTASPRNSRRSLCLILRKQRRNSFNKNTSFHFVFAVMQSINQPANQPTNEWDSQPILVIIYQLASQPTSQPASQPANSLINQPVNKQVSHPRA